MTDILFGQSYFLRFDPKLWSAMQPYPPLGTLYAASYARSKGYSVALFDSMLADSELQWGAMLKSVRPRFACIFEDNFNYLSKMCLLRMRQAAIRMIEMAKAEGCIIILCGADMTDQAGLYFGHGADFVLIGEGEHTLGELLDALTGASHRPVSEILGLAYPKAASTAAPAAPIERAYHCAPRRPDIRDLDSLPFPAWDLVDIDRYRTIWIERHGYYSMNMVTTRGCPYHCNWCAKPIWGQRYNARSPRNVVEEMRWLKETFAPDHIWFADDIFGLKPNWIEQFAALLHEAGLQIPFKCLQRADLVTEPVANALKSAGCKTVWMGAESGSQKILDAMDKGDSVEDVLNTTRLLQARGIEVGFFLQFGYPGETWDDVQLTLQMVRHCLPDEIGISVSYPLPGTKFYDRVKDELGGKHNWIDSDDLAMLYRGEFPQQFYRILHRRVHHEFRMRRTLAGRHSGGTLKIARQWAAVPWHALAVARDEWLLRRIVQQS